MNNEEQPQLAQQQHRPNSQQGQQQKAQLPTDQQRKNMQQGQNQINVEPQRSYSPSSSSSKSEQQLSQDNEKKPVQEGTEKTRYKYCCKICKHTDRGKKACVCVVPLSQRRTLLGDQGCQTCKCHGCSIEDFVSRGEDPVYKIVKVPSKKEDESFDGKNGCCRKCMKAFSKNNKACLCQVPQNVRKGRIPSGGCKVCGCDGCNPEDHKNIPNQQKRRHSRSRSRQRRRKYRSPSSSRSFDSEIDISQMHFNNFDRSILGNMIVSDFRIMPALMGFGIPQRTSSYILNKKH